MQLHCSPKEQIVFDQLKLIDRRRLRVLETANSRFPAHSLRKYLELECENLRNFEFRERLDDAMDDSGPSVYLKKLAFEIELNEARQVKALLSHPTIIQEQIQQVILEGAQVAGQDAARDYLRSSRRTENFRSINLAELYSVLSRLIFLELPSDHSAFSSIRPLSDISIHFKKCVHIEAWRSAEIDPKIMSDIEHAWISGILEIIRPDVRHLRITSISRGDSYGRDKFIPNNKYVSI